MFGFLTREGNKCGNCKQKQVSIVKMKEDCCAACFPAVVGERACACMLLQIYSLNSTCFRSNKSPISHHHLRLSNNKHAPQHKQSESQVRAAWLLNMKHREAVRVKDTRWIHQSEGHRLSSWCARTGVFDIIHVWMGETGSWKHFSGR